MVGEAYLKLKDMNKWFFIVLLRRGLCYIKLAEGGGEAIKLAGTLYVAPPIEKGGIIIL